MNEYEIGLEDRKTKKRWAGENYGWQSKESYDKLYTQGKLNPVQQQIDRVTSSVSRAVMSAPVAGPAIKAVQSGIRFTYEALPAPVQQTVTKGLETTQTAAENIAAATGLPVSLTDPLTIADIGTGGASALASKSVRQAVKTGVKGLADDLMTPPTGMVPALAGVGGGVRFTPKPVVPTFTEQLAKPLQIASNLEETGWQGSVRTLLDSKAPKEQIKRVLAKPYHKDLPKAYQYVSMDDFAANKGGWLDIMVEKAESFKQGMREFRKKPRASTQRRMYDDYTENPLNPDKQLYDPTNPVRKAVTQAFNTVVGKEWHHIFGNKEAAEFMLSRVAQDPYVAVNLIHHLHRIGLPTSGVPQNIALMKKAAHRKTGGYHSWSKALGFENVGKKRGVLEISDYGQEISKAILSGQTDVTELFEILSTYSKVVEKVIKPKIQELGGEVISDMGPVMKYIQGTRKRSK